MCCVSFLCLLQSFRYGEEGSPSAAQSFSQVVRLLWAVSDLLRVATPSRRLKSLKKKPQSVRCGTHRTYPGQKNVDFAIPFFLGPVSPTLQDRNHRL